MLINGPLKLAATLQHIRSRRLSDEAAAAQAAAAKAAGKITAAPTAAGHADAGAAAAAASLARFPPSRRRTAGSNAVVAEASLAHRWDAAEGVVATPRVRSQRLPRFESASGLNGGGSAGPSRKGAGLAAAAETHARRARARWENDVTVGNCFPWRFSFGLRVGLGAGGVIPLNPWRESS